MPLTAGEERRNPLPPAARAVKLAQDTKGAFDVTMSQYGNKHTK
jgi:hypothetical protein